MTLASQVVLFVTVICQNYNHTCKMYCEGKCRVMNVKSGASYRNHVLCKVKYPRKHCVTQMDIYKRTREHYKYCVY